jgi:hypothetical protein
MAETLSVSDMLPNKFEPKRTNRWVLQLEGIDAFLIKTAKRPSMTIEEITIPFINSKRAMLLVDSSLIQWKSHFMILLHLQVLSR